MMEIRVKRANELDAQEQAHVNAMDAVCFGNDPEAIKFDWAGSDWCVLGKIDQQVVSQVGLLKREIKVAGSPLWVGGVGGVMTHPDYQRKGLAAVLLKEAASYMAGQLKVNFGLLLCSPHRVAYYQKSGWMRVKDETRCANHGKQVIFPDPVMVISLSIWPWPSGLIDLCGLPW
ncbi:MAG TPA: GNAT family N-acetyltransferase [Anaerolineaceae bacterium]